jgi:hypothetical protein
MIGEFTADHWEQRPEGRCKKNSPKSCCLDSKTYVGHSICIPAQLLVTMFSKARVEASNRY